MSKLLFIVCFVTFNFLPTSDSWKAVPANQAMYALRSRNLGLNIQRTENVPDELLPRTYLHSVYKFGWCTPDSVKIQYMRKAINVTLLTWQDSQADYIYVLAHKHTQNFALQCVVMRTYVSKKYLFRNSRLPIYYCQGVVIILMMNTIQKMEIHEFYLHSKLNMPANFGFEFYQPPLL